MPITQESIDQHLLSLGIETKKLMLTANGEIKRLNLTNEGHISASLHVAKQALLMCKNTHEWMEDVVRLIGDGESSTALEIVRRKRAHQQNSLLELCLWGCVLAARTSSRISVLFPFYSLILLARQEHGDSFAAAILEKQRGFLLELTDA